MKLHTMCRTHNWTPEIRRPKNYSVLYTDHYDELRDSVDRIKNDQAILCKSNRVPVKTRIKRLHVYVHRVPFGNITKLYSYFEYLSETMKKLLKKAIHRLPHLRKIHTWRPINTLMNFPYRSVGVIIVTTFLIFYLYVGVYVHLLPSKVDISLQTEQNGLFQNVRIFATFNETHGMYNDYSVVGLCKFNI